MNILKQLYCNQYYELKPKGKGESALENGTALVSIMLVLIALAIFFILVSIFPNMEDRFEDLFGHRSGKTIGRFIAAVFFIICYISVKLTLGKKEAFNKTITEFEALDRLAQKRISQNGLVYFISSIGLFVVSLILYLIAT